MIWTYILVGSVIFWVTGGLVAYLAWRYLS
jgi:hypothetical protein